VLSSWRWARRTPRRNSIDGGGSSDRRGSSTAPSALEKLKVGRLSFLSLNHSAGTLCCCSLLRIALYFGGRGFGSCALFRIFAAEFPSTATVSPLGHVAPAVQEKDKYRGRTTSDPLASATHKQATHVRQTHVSFFPSAQWHLTLSFPCVL